MREGIKKKAFAQQRKNRKEAKKDVTWKTRGNRDPGIPSSFPYKDRIITELEDQRREVQDLKDAAKAKKQADRAAARARGETVEEIEVEEEDDDGQGGLSALLESAQSAAKAYGDDDAQDDDEEMESDVEYDISEDENPTPGTDNSRKAYDKIFKNVVDASDVILYVLDARDPEATRSKKVEAAVLQSRGKRLILILNKVDLIPEPVMTKWLDFLKASFPTIPVKASPGATAGNAFNKNLSLQLTANTVLQALKAYATHANLKRSLIVGVIGYPNVGKSSIINALTNRHGNNSKGCPVGNQAGITTSMREVKIDNKLKILDSPGIVFPEELGSKNKDAKLALLSALPPKAVIDPIPAVQLLLKKLSQDPEMAEGLRKYYLLPALPSSDLNEFTRQFLIHIARTRGRLGRGGVPNLDSSAMAVLSDWRDGRLLGWTLPKSSRESLADEPKSIFKKESARVEETSIVSEWSKEFDLDGLL